MQFTFRKGLNTDTEGTQVGGPVEAATVSTVAFLGADYPGVAFDLKVAKGDLVITGQTLCVDRRRPEIKFVSPAAGRVNRIRLGARRRLEALEISCDGEANGEASSEFDVAGVAQTDAALRQLLLLSGAWASFQTRPFGHVPDPANRPHAIFVTATDTNPLAPDPLTVLAAQAAFFQRGAEALLHLTHGPVFICQPDGAPLVSAVDRLQIMTFSGPHPAGLAGTHIHHVMPVSRQRSVWQIGYQDVAAIGHLLHTGRIMARRIVSVGTAGLAKPALVEAPLGARLADLLRGRTHADAPQMLSGSILSGQMEVYLRRHDLQVTAIARGQDNDRTPPFWHRLLDCLPPSPTGATLPLEKFERAFPFDLLPVPMMRALAVGDAEAAERLGCLELLEDDLALLSHLCPSGNDYGMLLRHTLEILAEEQAA